MAKRTRQIEPYLKIPAHILGLTEIGLSEKVLLAHIYSFGPRGCWQSNATLGRVFQTSERTISRWLAGIVAAGLVYVKNPGGYYRTLWAKSHPEVQMVARWYQKLRETGQIGPGPRRERRTRIDRNGEATSPEMSNYNNRNYAIRETRIAASTAATAATDVRRGPIIEERRREDHRAIWTGNRAAEMVQYRCNRASPERRAAVAVVFRRCRAFIRPAVACLWRCLSWGMQASASRLRCGEDGGRDVSHPAFGRALSQPGMMGLWGSSGDMNSHEVTEETGLS